MLTRCLQSLGSSWFALSPVRHNYGWSPVFSICDWWTRYPPWLPYSYSYFNYSPQPVNWRPPYQFYRGYRTVFQCLGFTHWQSSWFHCSPHFMEPKENERFPKRRKYEDEESAKHDSRSSSPVWPHSPREHRPKEHSPRQHSPREHSPREHSPRKYREYSPGEHSPREYSPREHSPIEHSPRKYREHSPREHSPREHSPVEHSPRKYRDYSPRERSPRERSPKEHSPREYRDYSPRERSPREHSPDLSSNEEAGDNDLQNRVSKTRKRRKGVLTRYWEDFSHHYENKLKLQEEPCNEPLEQKHIDFSVMSYNILSQDLLEDNIYLYRHCRYSVLNWGYRLQNILQELQELNADILCLQEVQEDHYRKQIKPRLEEMGYECEYKMRTGSKPDGCAICFKRSKFTLVKAKPVEFFRRSIELLDRDNIGLITLLQPTLQCRTSPNICIANTHLLYNPRRGDIKLTQLAMLLAEVDNVAHQKDGTYCPIVLCGDFNSVPYSPLYNFITEGKLNYYGLTIGKVSGQESPHRGQRRLPVPIWPKRLGISQNCQYETEQQQNTDETEAASDDESDEDESDEEISPETEMLLSQLKHPFCLSSVYSHFQPETKIPEVTTCHSKTALTVDYIFYSSDKDNISAQPAEGAEDDVGWEQYRAALQQEQLQQREGSSVAVTTVGEHESSPSPQVVVGQQWSSWEDAVKQLGSAGTELEESFKECEENQEARRLDKEGAEVTPNKCLKLLGRLSLLTEEDLWKVNSLPNESNSSDHLPLLAKFRLEL